MCKNKQSKNIRDMKQKDFKAVAKCVCNDKSYEIINHDITKVWCNNNHLYGTNAFVMVGIKTDYPTEWENCLVSTDQKNVSKPTWNWKKWTKHLLSKPKEKCIDTFTLDKEQIEKGLELCKQKNDVKYIRINDVFFEKRNMKIVLDLMKQYGVYKFQLFNYEQRNTRLFIENENITCTAVATFFSIEKIDKINYSKWL